MGATRPRDWKQAPFSGINWYDSEVWTRRVERDLEYGGMVETLTLDKELLHKKIYAAILDPVEASRFHANKKAYVDGLFGRGTFDAYTKHERPTIKNLYRDDRTDAMALWTGTSTTDTTTTAGTITTAGTSDGFGYWYDGIRNTTFFNEVKDIQNKMASKHLPKEPRFKFRKRRVKTFPFKGSKHTSLLDQLQQEFDHWAGDQMKVICD